MKVCFIHCCRWIWFLISSWSSTETHFKKRESPQTRREEISLSLHFLSCWISLSLWSILCPWESGFRSSSLTGEYVVPEATFELSSFCVWKRKTRNQRREKISRLPLSIDSRLLDKHLDSERKRHTKNNEKDSRTREHDISLEWLFFQ
jgi:hypothetical protein